MIVEALRWDPFQSRVSPKPILLQNPRTLVKKPLSEYVEDIIGDSRFAIETETDLVFVGMAKNSAFGRIFIPIAIADKRILVSRGPEEAVVEVEEWKKRVILA